MTKRSLIAISRALGAGGEEIGRIVAAELKLRYADDEIIVRASEAAGVAPDAVQEAEKTPGLIGRVLESLGRYPMLTDTHMVTPVLAEPPPDYESLIEGVVRETGAAGDVVIVGHGASMALAGMPNLLRVLITAPVAVRAARLAKPAEMDESKAKKAVEDSDRQRRQYLRRFYDVDDELPTHYDLVVNTETLSHEAAARIVIAAVAA